MENPRKIADIIKIIIEYHRPSIAVIIDSTKRKKLRINNYDMLLALLYVYHYSKIYMKL